MSPNIAFLGAGNMGSAIISALIQGQVIPSANLRVCDPNPEKLQQFVQQGIVVSEHAEEVLPDSDFVFLAIKPQGAGEILRMLNGSFEANTVLISIAAGVSVAFLQKTSGLKKIVRVMPNTPAMVGMGVSGVYFPKEISAEEKNFIKKLLKSFSAVIDCKSEKQIDELTTISGCGPAYFFRILEILAEKAESFGFSQEDARTMVLETLRGAGELARRSEESFQILREKVTSKGGVTEAALQVFTEKNLETIINDVIDAAFKKSQQIQKQV